MVIHGSLLAPIIAVRVEIDASAVKTIKVIETMGVGAGRGVAAEVPFADCRGPVPGAFEVGTEICRPGVRLRPLVGTPARAGTRPDKIEARDGAQTGALECQFEKTVPARARESM